ncbi:MAG: DUF255 domain-containing protein [Candidatus Electrothrix sp. AR4]|nr:DUF255 domain-containing protein [Candidatus Electrothrix sp. AR4]
MIKNYPSDYFFFFLSLASSGCQAKIGKTYWNDNNITWNEYNEGLAQAKKERKPTIIIFYSDSCSACRKYKKVFQEKSVVDAASSFVMIRVNTGKHPKLSDAYRFDGRYVPRTFAVYPDGKVMQKIYPSKKYKYFIGLASENLLELMRKAHSQMPKKH